MRSVSLLFQLHKYLTADPSGCKWFKTSVYGHSLAGIVGSNPTGRMNTCRCEIEVPATGRTLLHRSPTEGGCVLDCDQMQQ